MQNTIEETQELEGDEILPLCQDNYPNIIST